MIWIKEKFDLAKALKLDKQQTTRLTNAMKKAYDEIGGNRKKTFSVDEVMEFVAPYIKSSEEACYCSLTIVTDIMAANESHIAMN